MIDGAQILSETKFIVWLNTWYVVLQLWVSSKGSTRAWWRSDADISHPKYWFKTIQFHICLSYIFLRFWYQVCARISSWWASLMPAGSTLCLVSLMMEDGFITLFDTKKCSFYFIDIIPWRWNNLLILNIVFDHAMRAWFPPMNGSIHSSLGSHWY